MSLQDEFDKETDLASEFDNEADLSAPAVEEDSTLDTLADTARGAAQGATFGFADELAGAAGAAGDVLTGQTTMEKILDAYRQNLEESRQAFKQAEERSPTAFTVGNVGGGILTGLATAGAAPALVGARGAAALANLRNAGTLGRIAEAGAIGAGSGAVAGLGTSEADLTQGEVGEALKDVGTGAAFGGVFGAGLQGGVEGIKGIGSAVKGAANLIGKTETAGNIGKAYQLGKEGTDIVTSKGLETAEEGVRAEARGLAKESKDVLSAAGKKVGEAKKAAASSTQDLSEELEKISEQISRLNISDDPDAINDVAKLQKWLQNLTEGKEGTGGIDPTSVEFKKAMEIKNTLNKFSGSKGGVPKIEDIEAQNELKQIAKSINDKLTTATPELASANKNYATVKQSLETLGLDPANDFVRDAATGQQRLTVAAEQKINSVIKRMARDTDAGENAAVKLNETLRMLEAVDPAKAQALKPRLQKASEVLDLAQKAQRLGLLNRSTYIKSGTVSAANVLGMGVKKLSDATPQQLQQITNTLMQRGGKSMKLVQPLVDAMKKDNVGRNAALFALQQNPEYREMLKEFLGEEEPQE